VLQNLDPHAGVGCGGKCILSALDSLMLLISFRYSCAYRIEAVE
jgi:nitrogenase subunit NifH